MTKPAGKIKGGAKSPCQRDPEPNKRDDMARGVLQPSVMAANTIHKLKFSDSVDVPGLVTALQEQVRKAIDGNLQRAEAMLITQAHTLNALFCALTGRALSQEYLSQYEVHMRLAFKAQSQCRATLETLAAVKNPQPVAFVRQANIAHGPQQVNNGVQPAASVAEASRARESENQPNELLEQHSHERLDAGTSQATGGTDLPVETVGTCRRTGNGGGQS